MEATHSHGTLKTARMTALAAVIILVGLLLISPASAATFVVTNTNDSGNGSLRWAMEQANTNVGSDSIHFGISGAGPHTIYPLSALPTITDPVVIDGYSQPGASPATPAGPATLKIELDGSQAGGVSGLKVSAGENTIRGLSVIHFGWHGLEIEGTGGNLIEGNHVGVNADGYADPSNGVHGINITAPNNTIGGSTAGARNVVAGDNIDGIRIVGANAFGNVVQGNYIGLNAYGSIGWSNQGGIVVWDAPLNTIGGTIPGAGNVSSGNYGGICIHESGSYGNVVQGNFVGTDVTGTSGVGNCYGGVYLTDAPNNTIGGTDPAARNVISENSWGGGLIIHGSASTGNLVQGNFIGTDVTGAVGISNYPYGIWIYDDASDNTIGGTTPESGNLIAHNDHSGICVASGAGNCILTNTIFSNGELGIDLECDGVTLNDLGDIDTGANDLQNFPVLTTAIIGDDTTIVLGTLNSTANTSFTLQFFYNGTPDFSEHGEGEVFLGETNVTTDGSGDATFTGMFGTTVPDNHHISATATSEDGNTSEFSELLIVGFSIEPSNGAVLLSWTGTLGADEYWVYGAANSPYFIPGMAPDYEHRLAVLPSSIYSWSTSSGVGNDLENWTFLIMALDSGGQELSRTNHAGEWDYFWDIP